MQGDPQPIRPEPPAVTVILQDQLLPARLVPWPKARLTSLQRCLVLAVLVHLWLALWLGNAPGGTAPLGQGVFGAINVTLRGPVTEGASAAVPPSVPANSTPPLEPVAPVPQVQTLPLPSPLPLPVPVPVPEAAPPTSTERLLQAPATAARAAQSALSPSTTVAEPLAPQPSPLPRLESEASRPGAPDVGAQVGRDVATPAGAAASAVPRLNLQLVRPRGGELSRGGTAGVFPVLPRPPERDEKLARDIEKSGRTDCRTAHSGAGLLAVIPLVVDALKKDGGCKW